MRIKLAKVLSVLLILSLVAEGSLTVYGADSVSADKGILHYALAAAKRAEATGETQNLIPRAKQALDDAIMGAEAMLEKDDAAASEVQEAYRVLQEAIWGLSYQRANKTALNNAIIRGEGVDLAGVSQEKIDAFYVAFQAASVLAANENLCAADEQLIAAAVTRLLSAISNLREDTSVPPSGGGAGGGAVTIPPKTLGSVDFDAYAKTEIPGDILARYADLDDKLWYTPGISFALASGLMVGVGEKEFAPQRVVDRASFVTVLYRLSGSPQIEGPAATWYGHAVQWAAFVGVTDGSNPTELITREQMATMLYRFSGDKAGKATLESFSDSKYISYWALESMVWGVENGIILGDQGGRLNPKASVTRAELATMLERYIKGASNS